MRARERRAWILKGLLTMDWERSRRAGWPWDDRTNGWHLRQAARSDGSLLEALYYLVEALDDALDTPGEAGRERVRRALEARRHKAEANRVRAVALRAERMSIAQIARKMTYERGDDTGSPPIDRRTVERWLMARKPPTD